MRSSIGRCASSASARAASPGRSPGADPRHHCPRRPARRPCCAPVPPACDRWSPAVEPTRSAISRQRRSSVELLSEGLRGLHDLRGQLLDPGRLLDQLALVPEVVADLSLYQMGGVGGELHAPLGVVEVDRVDQPHGAFLEQVVVRLAQAGELPRHGLHQVEMLRDQLVSRVVSPVSRYARTSVSTPRTSPCDSPCRIAARPAPPLAVGSHVPGC